MEELKDWLQNLVLKETMDCIDYIELMKRSNKIKTDPRPDLDIFIEEERKKPNFMQR